MTMQLGDRWTAEPVRECEAISVTEFRREHVMANVPLIRRGAVSDWDAVGKWTPEWFGEHYGDRPLRSGTEVIVDVVDSIHDTSADANMYARNLLLADLDRGLVRDVDPLPGHVTAQNWLRSPLIPGSKRRFSGELFIAPANMKFPYLHFDSCHVHANFFMIRGTKEVALFAPSQAPYLYVMEGLSKVDHVSAVNDVYSPDLESFPEFAHARGTVVTLHPGDHLFVPSGWWHAVRSPEPSISYVVKAAGAENWHHVVEDFPKRYQGRPALGTLSRMYLSAIGRLRSRGR